MNSSSLDENNFINCPSINAWIATIEDSIISQQLVVTMFGASWSEPSKVMYDMLVQQKKAFPDVIFCKVDTDICKELTSHMVVRIVPTLIFVLEGKEVGRLKRSASPELLHQKILSYQQGKQLL